MGCFDIFIFEEGTPLAHHGAASQCKDIGRGMQTYYVKLDGSVMLGDTFCSNINGVLCLGTCRLLVSRGKVQRWEELDGWRNSYNPPKYHDWPFRPDTAPTAEQELKSLKADNSRIRKALEDCLYHFEKCNDGPGHTIDIELEMLEVCREALGKK